MKNGRGFNLFPPEPSSKYIYIYIHNEFSYIYISYMPSGDRGTIY